MLLGATKKRLSDDETSSEGRRRMPRTNARAWPRTNPVENEIWLDAPPPPISRDQWHIPGNANPNPLPHNNPVHNYHAVQQPSQCQQPQTANYSKYEYSVSPQPAAWLSLAQYNGPPQQIAQITTPGHSHSRQAWVDSPEQKANGNYMEVAKQELWVDGPTAFRKNIEGLTHNLQKDQQLSPTRRHHRY